MGKSSPGAPETMLKYMVKVEKKKKFNLCMTAVTVAGNSGGSITHVDTSEGSIRHTPVSD
jgi:hypothetical protein